MTNLHNRNAVMQAFYRARENLSKLSLQGRFLLVVGVSSLFVTLMMWALFSKFTDHLMTRIGSRFAEKQMLYDKARTLEPLIFEIVHASQAADTPLIREWALHEDNPVLSSVSVDFLRNKFSSDNFFIAFAHSGHFSYYDAESKSNKPVVHYKLDPNDAADKLMLDFMQRGDDHDSFVATNSRLGVNRIWLMASIQSGGKFIGVLGTSIELGDFVRGATNVNLPGATNMFLSGNGNIEIYNDVDHFDFPRIAGFTEPEHSAIQMMSATDGNQWVRNAIQRLENGTSGIETEFVEINGKRYLAGMIALPEVGWYDLTLLNLSVLMPQSDYLKIIVAIVISTLAMLAILTITLHKLVLKPVSTLAVAVEHIRQGDFSPTTLEKGSGEVNRLIAQFQEMASSVQNTQQWLETEIEKRTQQLTDARRVLEIALKHEKEGRETQANLMALMAHEMRSPIAVISNTAQMLDMLTKTEHPEWQPRISKIMKSVRDLVILMDTFLSDKWLDMDQRGLNRIKGDLNALCNEITRDLVENHHRNIRFYPSPCEASFCADWQLVRIAVLNLLDNARKYSSLNAEISLRVISCDSEMLCIEVSDQGIGIPDELQPRIFEKYARGQHESDIKGSGLGLYLVNWIARFHGGYTNLTSVHGQGSVFRLYFPTCDADAAEDVGAFCPTDFQ